MTLFTRRYQKTGLVFALAISFMYFPLLLGVLDTNKFIPNQVLNFIVLVSFCITFITTINYKIVLTAKNRFPNPRLKFLIAPINFFIMLLIFIFLPFEIENNIFLFSSIFLGVPWIYFFIKITKNHCASLKLYKNSNGKR